MKNRKIDQKTTMQLVVDKGYHTLLKIKAAEASMTIKELVEGYLADLLAVKGSKENREKFYE